MKLSAIIINTSPAAKIVRRAPPPPYYSSPGLQADHKFLTPCIIDFTVMANILNTNFIYNIGNQYY